MPLDRQTQQVTSQLSSGIWQVLHSSPFLTSVSSHSQQQRSQECCQGQSAAVCNEQEVVFFGLIFSMVGLEWEPLLVAQHVGSLVVDHWSSFQLFCWGWFRCSISVRSLYIMVDILPLIFLILQLRWSLA